MKPIDSLPLPPRDLPPAPGYRSPVLVGTYSHLPDRSITFDDASMAYYTPAQAGADLSYGFERRVERYESVQEHLDGLCESIMRYGGERPGGIITWRGMMTKWVTSRILLMRRIMTAPFSQDAWEMNLLALGGSVYVEQYESPAAREERYGSRVGDC